MSGVHMKALLFAALSIRLVAAWHKHSWHYAINMANQSPALTYITSYEAPAPTPGTPEDYTWILEEMSYPAPDAGPATTVTLPAVVHPRNADDTVTTSESTTQHTVHAGKPTTVSRHRRSPEMTSEPTVKGAVHALTAIVSKAAQDHHDQTARVVSTKTTRMSTVTYAGKAYIFSEVQQEIISALSCEEGGFCESSSATTSEPPAYRTVNVGGNPYTVRRTRRDVDPEVTEFVDATTLTENIFIATSTFTSTHYETNFPTPVTSTAYFPVFPETTTLWDCGRPKGAEIETSVLATRTGKHAGLFCFTGITPDIMTVVAPTSAPTVKKVETVYQTTTAAPKIHYVYPVIKIVTATTKHSTENKPSHHHKPHRTSKHSVHGTETHHRKPHHTSEQSEHSTETHSSHHRKPHPTSKQSQTSSVHHSTKEDSKTTSSRRSTKETSTGKHRSTPSQPTTSPHTTSKKHSTTSSPTHAHTTSEETSTKKHSTLTSTRRTTSEMTSTTKRPTASRPTSSEKTSTRTHSTKSPATSSKKTSVEFPSATTITQTDTIFPTKKTSTEIPSATTITLTDTIFPTKTSTPKHVMTTTLDTSSSTETWEQIDTASSTWSEWPAEGTWPAGFGTWPVNPHIAIAL